MKYGNIKFCDTADGTGVRVTLFVSGCTTHCKGCHNPETWDFNYGKEFTEIETEEIITALNKEYISGLTLCGGDPFEKENQPVILDLLRKIRKNCPNKNIWSYTGKVLDRDLIKGGKYYTEYTDNILELIDVLIDGPFILSERNISLKFRGSDNQRIIDMKIYNTSKNIVTI